LKRKSKRRLLKNKPPTSRNAELKPVVDKKPRSEAQKAAFEKARAKRAENLKKKQEEEVATQVEDKPAPKKRG
jgi:hypothetical protein